LFVRDCAAGIVAALNRYDESDPVNIGSGMEISISDLVKLIAELTGFEGGLRFDTSKPDGQPRRRLDTSRARERFGWQAETDFRTGLRATIDWYVASRKEAKAPQTSGTA
jgi:dTDP-glucose 4,6-dehydratase/GDP-L-fucose synthase